MSVPDRQAEVADPETGERLTVPLAELEPAPGAELEPAPLAEFPKSGDSCG